jgi:PiT family inorganic phosphate transporter
MLSAAKKVVPILIAIMAMAFATYLSLKGLKKIVKIDLVTALGIGFSVAVVIYFIMSSYVKKAVLTLANEKASIGKLFTVPLIFAAALLSFAHGANDVANAIGPLAAINDAIINGGISTKATIPLWVMIVGAVGISIGLALFGPKLIRTVGSEITELDQIRAYAVAMAAAITVIIASQLGLPVSSTHIAVGAVFGVGFLREFLNDRYVMSKKAYLLAHFKEEGEKVESFIERFKTKSSTEQREMLAQVKKKSVPLKNDLVLTKKERKVLRKIMKEEFVKRSHVKKIIAAWIITVPAAGVLSALLFFTIRGFMI